ncbi:hypothetical protein GQ457_01G011420 [Hibiscus cannabinus]
MAKSFACFVLLALIVSCALGQAPSSAPTRSPPSSSPTPAPKASPTASPTSSPTASPPSTATTPSAAPESSPTSSPPAPPTAPTAGGPTNGVIPPSSISDAPGSSPTSSPNAADLNRVTMAGSAVVAVIAAAALKCVETWKVERRACCLVFYGVCRSTFTSFVTFGCRSTPTVGYRRWVVGGNSRGGPTADMGGDGVTTGGGIEREVRDFEF